MKIVVDDPAVASVGSFFGGGSGSPLNTARMFVSLKPKGHGNGDRTVSVGTVIARLRKKLSKIPGAALFLVPGPDIRFGRRMSKSACFGRWSWFWPRRVAWREH